MPKHSKRILVADDEETIRRLLDYNLRKFDFEPVLAANGREAIALAQGEFACVLVDLKMPELDGMGVLSHFKQYFPDVPVVIMSAVGQVKDAVGAMKAGALEYVTKPFDLDEVLALMVSAARMGHALQENRQLRDTVARPAPDSDFAGESPTAKQLLETVARIAPLDSTVLITGESGVGKGLLARMIHHASKRAEGPFITTSCPALPRELLESEMFGHERGAFTGAQQRRIGRIEMAEGGTLFLDEIGDLPLLLQPKLLNVLQDRQFTRLGGSQVVDADIRLIAATNADLQEKVAGKEFREDLYYRLNVIPIRIPPLRERLEDVPVLSRQILLRIARSRGGCPLELGVRALAKMACYKWPGNIRELENVLERASAFCDGPEIEERHLPAELGKHPEILAGRTTSGRAVPSLAGVALEDVEKLAIQQTLELCKGNKAAAARHLGITEKTIYNKMARFGLR
jgi:DNA-binding NtrC family response regulator